MVGLIRSVGYVMLLNENLEDLLINGKLLGKKLPFPGMGMDKNIEQTIFLTIPIPGNGW